MNVARFKVEVFALKNVLYRIAMRLLCNAAEAEDAVQNTMMKMWQIREELDEKDQLSAYVIRCLQNDCLNRLKRSQTISLHHKVIEKQQPDHTHILNGNMIEIIKTEINKLPEKQRLIIQLLDVEGFETREVASILQIDENAVRVNLFRARKKVKMKLQKIKEYEAKQL